jgi:CHAT domain-containing protein/tetratricopeptide (TPR) repeat protein
MAFWRRRKAAAAAQLGLQYLNSYIDSPTGDRAANLQRAIACFTEALGGITAKTDAAGYAQIQLGLGIAYSELPAEDWVASLERAGFTEVLPSYAVEAARARMAAEARAANLQRAIESFTEALRFYTAETAPDDNAKIEYNLGFCYHQLPTGNRAANLERAINCYTQALRFFTAEVAPSEYARTQNNLGDAYQQLPGGDRAANLERAIDCYTQALRLYTADAAPFDYAMAQYNLGNAYQAQYVMGHTYWIPPAEDRADNLERAINCYTEALRFYTAESTPSQYAMAQHNLGLTFLHAGLGGEDQVTNLTRAIECNTEALRFLTAETAPSEYAMTQFNLGNAYRVLPGGDRAANVTRSIECYTEALRFHTPKTAPSEYARTQHNLGISYVILPIRDRSANLQRAIESFTEALRFHTAETAPSEYAAGQCCLGAVYLELPTGNRSANVTRAIECYTEALRFYTAESTPFEYAMAQSHLGAVYLELPTGNRSANVTRAIECYTEALRFYTAEIAPFEHAWTQYDLGNAYRGLPDGDRSANLERAIGCYTEALRFFTAERTPVECRRRVRTLGEVFFEQDRWAEAHKAYSLAIRASELLYQAAGAEEGRQAELGVAWDAVAADAYCLARLGRLAEAVQRLEAGRARSLSEALARDHAVLQEANDADRAAFIAAADRIKALEAEGRREPDPERPVTAGPRTYAKLSAELVRARGELAGVVERIRVYRPGFMGERLDYPDIAGAASPARPLVYLMTTSRGGLALLVQAGPQAPAPEHAIWLDGLTAKRLEELLVRQDPSGEPRGRDLDQLAPAVAENLEVLHREVLGPIAGRLADLGLAAATIVPAGRLSLFPLSAAAPEGCTIALASSARALLAARLALRERVAQAPVLLAAANPLPLPAGWDTLRYAVVEAAAIQSHFPTGSSRVLPEEAATLEAFTQHLAGATHLHLACHGGFDYREPLDSGLYLSGGERLTLRDLLDGDLDLSNQRLAVLSACQTGITEFSRVPDEVIGLPSGFLQAGVPGVVATLWSVNDRSTAVLVAEFYRLLLTELPDPATALSSARGYLRDATARDLAEWFDRRYDDSGGTDVDAYRAAADFRSRPNQAERPYADPVYWAGFAYTGP